MTLKFEQLRDHMRARMSEALADGDALRALAAARDLRALLYEWEGVLARKGVVEGASWEEIGALLGVSRQAAWTRYRDPAMETPAIREARERVAKARRK